MRKYLDISLDNNKMRVRLEPDSLVLHNPINIGTALYDFEQNVGGWLRNVAVLGIRQNGLEVVPVDINYDDLDEVYVSYDPDEVRLIPINNLWRFEDSVFMEGLEYQREVHYFWGLIDDLHLAQIRNLHDEKVLKDIQSKMDKVNNTIIHLQKVQRKAFDMAVEKLDLEDLPSVQEIVSTYYNKA